MNFLGKMLENSRKNIFRDKQTANKLPLLFFHVKVLTETQLFYSWALSTNKQGPGYVFSF